VLYKEFAQKPELKLPIYALPLFGTDWNASQVRYHGMARIKKVLYSMNISNG
jgi:hypothetical protein